MSRTRALTEASNTAINAVIDTVNVLNNRYYVARNHTDEGCFYFPEPSDSPVVFRGTCDLSIPALANFNPVQVRLLIFYFCANSMFQIFFIVCSFKYPTLQKT